MSRDREIENLKYTISVLQTTKREQAELIRDWKSMHDSEVDKCRELRAENKAQAEQIAKLQNSALYHENKQLKEDGITLETQNRIQAHVKKICNMDHEPDGSGCDSGDPVEVTLAEITEAVGDMEMRYEDGLDEVEGRVVWLQEQFKRILRHSRCSYSVGIASKALAAPTQKEDSDEIL